MTTTLNNLKKFSKKIMDLDEKIKSKTFDLNNCTTATTNNSSNSGSSNETSIITTITNNNSSSNGTNITTTNNSGSSNGTNTITTTNKSEKIQKDIDELVVKVVNLVETIMPPTFLESMLIIPREKLDSYRLHKIVIAEYNKYIDEMCDNVNDISNNLSTDNKNYSFIKNNQRRSRKSFPSFKNKLNEILLNYASEFRFKEHQEKDDHYHQHQQEEEDHSHHNRCDEKKILKKINKKKIKYMKKKLFKEFETYKKNNPDNINLDLREYPPVEIKQIGEKIKDLKSVDSISEHYDLSKFQTVEGKY